MSGLRLFEFAWSKLRANAFLAHKSLNQFDSSFIVAGTKGLATRFLPAERQFVPSARGSFCPYQKRPNGGKFFPVVASLAGSVRQSLPRGKSGPAEKSRKTATSWILRMVAWTLLMRRARRCVFQNGAASLRTRNVRHQP